MAGIFISYRRGDSSGYAGWLREHLAARFGAERIFMDVDTIEPGSDFVESIDRAVGSCDVLLAVIGDEWLAATDDEGHRRLDSPRDFVRLEIATALARGVRVIPVLVDGAPMPPVDAVPDDLEPLTRRQAIELSHARWRHDSGQLVAALERILGDAPAATAAAPAPAEPAPPSPANAETPPAPPSPGNADPPPAPPGYRIEGVLHQGELGTLYRAVQTALKREVALRILAGEEASDPAFRQRFLREAEVVAAVWHPNILPVYDAGEDGTRVFTASRLIEGGSLWRLRHDEGRLDPPRAAELVAQAADGLHAAHERGIVHADVNLINVLVGNEDGREHAYVTGFGLATRQTTQPALTRSGHILGTPAYMAPELIRGEPSDARTDVYSLGCVLFHLLTGRLPFESTELVAQLFAHLTDEIPPLTEAAPDVPPSYDEIVKRATAKDPATRYESAAALAQALRAAVDGDTPEVSG
jgi:Protein kinase domain/TIR domain